MDIYLFVSLSLILFTIIVFITLRIKEIKKDSEEKVLSADDFEIIE